MAAAHKRRDADIRLVFDRLSDDALLDDAQLGAMADRSPATIKRWRREGKAPRVIILNGLPRFRVGDARPWLRGKIEPMESARFLVTEPVKQMPATQLRLFDDRPSYGEPLGDELRSFTFNGEPTIVEKRDRIDFFFNEFWTARQRQANRLHEVSYRACFKPQLPEFFISRLTRSGATVYDPFMGRGTTLLQAALMGRRAIGNDINPLSVVLTRPRLSPPNIEAIAKRLKEIKWGFGGKIEDSLLVFFHKQTLMQIHALREWFFSREADDRLDSVDDWIRMVAINRLTGHSPGFFSVYTMPPNQAISVAAQAKINEKRSQVPPKRDVPSVILKKSRILLSGEHPPLREGHKLFTASANRTPEIDGSSVDLVVTSPPFLDVVQYADDNWLRCWFLGIDASSVPITAHRNPEDWTAFIRETFKELARVVRIGGHVAFEVGEVRNGRIELERLVLDAIARLPFDPVGVLINMQEFTKTANCWGISNNSKGTNTNRVVIARRTATTLSAAEKSV
jgi:hypothetical protein